jgi:hypothetical protein
MAFPGTYNINYYEGDRFDFSIKPLMANGAIFDLTGYSVDFVIATSAGPSPANSYIGTATIEDNTAYCVITPTLGRSLTAGTTYYYDVQVKKVDYVYTLLRGTVTVTADVAGA